MICERKNFFIAEIFRVQGNVTRQVSQISLLKFRIAVAEVTMYEYLFDFRFAEFYIDLMFHSRVLLACILQYTLRACVRACATTVTKIRSVCISAALHVLFPRIINYSLSICPYLRYLLYYLLDTYVCARVYISIYMNVRVYLFLYIFTYRDVCSSSTFNLYLSKERTQLASVI